MATNSCWIWLLLIVSLQLCNFVNSLPLVDPGLFVIHGVKTCGSGGGYCMLGADCTLDHDFLPDDKEGHCDGLRSAFTPSASFVCCRLNPDTVSNLTVHQHHQDKIKDKIRNKLNQTITESEEDEDKWFNENEAKIGEQVIEMMQMTTEKSNNVSDKMVLSDQSRNDNNATILNNNEIKGNNTNDLMKKQKLENSSKTRINHNDFKRVKNNTNLKAETLPEPLKVESKYADGLLIDLGSSSDENPFSNMNHNANDEEEEEEEEEDSEVEEEEESESQSINTQEVENEEEQKKKTEQSEEVEEEGEIEDEDEEEEQESEEVFVPSSSSKPVVEVEEEEELEEEELVSPLSSSKPVEEEEEEEQEEEEVAAPSSSSKPVTEEENDEDEEEEEEEKPLDVQITNMVQSGPVVENEIASSSTTTTAATTTTTTKRPLKTRTKPTRKPTKGKYTTTSTPSTTTKTTTTMTTTTTTNPTPITDRIINEIEMDNENENWETTDVKEIQSATEVAKTDLTTTPTTTTELIDNLEISDTSTDNPEIVTTEQVKTTTTELLPTTIEPSEENKETENEISTEMPVEENLTTESTKEETTTTTEMYTTTTDMETTTQEMAEECDESIMRHASCWFVQFTNGTERVCTGSFLKPDVIVTSASCSIRLFQVGIENLQVVVGDHITSDIRVRSVLIHEEYRPADENFSTSSNDLGLLRLEPPQEQACSLCLPQEDQQFTGENCFAGNVEARDAQQASDNCLPCRPENLPENATDEMKAICENECRSYRELISSGVPLVCGPYLAGVGTSAANDLRLYAPVGRHVPWIRECIRSGF